MKAFKEKGIEVWKEWNNWKNTQPRDQKKADEIADKVKDLQKELEKHKDTKDKDGKNCLEKLGYPYETAKKHLQTMLDSLKKKD